jgi:hypothetical protein
MDAEKDEEVNTWVIFWDDLGIDSLVNLTGVDCEDTMKRLQEGSALDRTSKILRVMQLRSRLNSHRNPEIWVFGASNRIDSEQITSTFDLNSNGLKRMIRDKGIKQFI